jgi:hypothetical protein
LREFTDESPVLPSLRCGPDELPPRQYELEGAIAMTAGHTTHRLSKMNAGPVPLAALLAVSLLTGGAVGAAITRQIDSANSGAAAAIAATFDAAAFRAGEHAPLAVTFDAAAFRAGERAPLVSTEP